MIHKASQGLTFTDSLYAARKEQALSIGLLWGAYHFGEKADPVGQADYFLSLVGTDRNTLLCLDWEPNPADRAWSMTAEGAGIFVQRVKEKTGRLPVIYTGKYWVDEWTVGVPLPTILSDCPLWIASYANAPVVPTQWSKYSLWQYTNGTDGPQPNSLPGLGAQDYSFFNGSLDELKKWWVGENMTDNPVIAAINSGDEVILVLKEFQDANGPEIIVSARLYKTPAPLPDVTLYVISPQGVNVRSGPGVAYPKVAALSFGDSVTVRGETFGVPASGYTWRQIVGGTNAGYLVAEKSPDAVLLSATAPK